MKEFKSFRRQPKPFDALSDEEAIERYIRPAAVHYWWRFECSLIDRFNEGREVPIPKPTLAEYASADYGAQS